MTARRQNGTPSIGVAEAKLAPSAPVGLAAVAGALAEWDELEHVVEEIYAARRRSADREPPSLE